MSGVVHIDLENEDTEVFHEKSISPIDISSMSFSDEDWLTKPVKEEKEIPKPQINHLDEKPLKPRQRTLGPEPLLPNKFHPLCYCYRLPEDFDHHPPRIYCVGEPLDDDIVIYSDIEDENVTWKELKEFKRNTPNLLKVFPLLQLKKHEEDEKIHLRALTSQENQVTREIECIKKATAWEKNRLETLFLKEIEEIKKLKLKSNHNSPHLDKKQPSLDTSAIKKATNTSRRDTRNSTTQQRRNNLKSAASLSSTSFDKHKLRPSIKALDKFYSLSDENVRKVRKVKAHLPNYTLQERLHYERHGCTQKEFEERKWQEKRLTVGVWY